MGRPRSSAILAYLAVLLALGLLLAGCGTAAQSATREGTSSSLAAPVSAGTDNGDWLGTTSTGAGPADLYCSVTFAASYPKSGVHVSLFSEAGEFIDARDGRDGDAPDYYTFKGLEPGKYRLGVYGVGTGYVSQWYGGLSIQGHDVSKSQVLELKPGRNTAEFVLQPGLSIKGDVSWTQGAPLGGYVSVYDLQHHDTGGGTTIGAGYPMQAGTSHEFLVVGLLPGRYRIGVSLDTNDLAPRLWDGGGSFEDAPVIDLTADDVAGVHVELGALPSPTVPSPSLTTTTSFVNTEETMDTSGTISEAEAVSIARDYIDQVAREHTTTAPPDVGTAANWAPTEIEITDALLGKPTRLYGPAGFTGPVWTLRMTTNKATVSVVVVIDAITGKVVGGLIW
jgi:hypothetical protein